MRQRLGEFELTLRSSGVSASTFDAPDVARVLHDAGESGTVHRLRMLLREQLAPGMLLDDQQVVELASRLLGRGEVVSTRSRRDGTFSRIDAEVAQEEPSSDEARTDWIEIVLVDEQQQPMRNVEYLLTLADGSRVRGRTNALGIGRHEGLVSGRCEVSLVDWHENDWWSAS